ncbi:glycine--tRNA ligase subunit beta [Phaeovibrio sulfidiphilus]|uniref:Glycine--tRNA ligase beta subunit n=1 Tax=Phaeovibrio sulfidiphilus TaxID=1220600 RepID=A0A8J7CQD2_9PROT|nr:glycine--tRNA ligase subunit beta [Phaeovibrio sulfidiphilus]MBE1236705.1 glycine--tRNA ligase subunit beta [Phaeovibrio sulfidiphilus]
MAELLFELFSEEIPARMQERAAQDLARLMETCLGEATLTFDRVQTCVTPRRLCAVVHGLPERQPDVSEERKGPREDAPAKAVEGFLSSVGLSLDQVERRETPKGTFLFAMIEKKGQDSRDILPGVLEKVIAAFPWPKSMRWGANRFAWVRPIHGVVALFDGVVLKGGIDLGGRMLPFSDTTRGHRFRAPEPFPVSGFADYCEKLANAHVVLDANERRTRIREGADAVAASMGLEVRPDPGLLNEVTGLVEWPEVLVGRIDDDCMSLPQEILTTSMRAHQKYFALQTADGSLAPHFVVVANGIRPEARETVIAGNERVLRARLSDARFFWDQDRAETLESRVAALNDRIFHAKLGTDFERVERIRRLAGVIARAWGVPDPAAVDRAALLSKADLSTGMVGEFPELQGVMGAYYARHDGEAQDVVEAIRSHYGPLGPSDRCPSAPVSVAVALADKLDTLAGFWLINEKPTGSKDPFALRRAALGVIRLILENNVRVRLRPLIDAAAEGHCAARTFSGASVTDDLMVFFAERLKVREREGGLRHDLIEAVFALAGEDDLVRLCARARALEDFVRTPGGSDLLAACRRAANIVRIESGKDGVDGFGAPDPALFGQDEERALGAALDEVNVEAAPLLAAEAYTDTMAVLARLRAPVDAFFEHVTVNAADRALRANRLGLLQSILATMSAVADFSKIEG